jgi:phospholipid/cholesterol/gamma-HCH transport system permease protein
MTHHVSFPCSFTIQHQPDRAVIILEGQWQVKYLDAVTSKMALLKTFAEKQFIFDFSAVEKIDTAGMWLITKTTRLLRAMGKEIDIKNLHAKYSSLFEIIEKFEPSTEARTVPVSLKSIITALGKMSYVLLHEIHVFTVFVGAITLALGRVFLQPQRFRAKLTLKHIVQIGMNALPIIGLIAFLITVVVVYQGASQLRQFGAEIFTIDLASISVLREMGVLLTAILVAGRSGSAFAAQIGTMELSEEVDALRTMGLDPVEILVLPRVLAMLISLPLLTFFADIMGLMGGWVMSVPLLGISTEQYFQRVHTAIGPWTFWVGMIKAPFFALLISIIGCLRGLQVKGSAENLGAMTTRAVVESIFLVIIADAALSILFFELGI